MFLDYQIPFMDVRQLTVNDKIFFYPYLFPKPVDQFPYYRRFGQARIRNEGDGIPLSEKNFINSRHVLKFNDQFRSLKLINIFERLFIDQYICHLDIGLKTIKKLSMSYKDFINYLSDLLTCNILTEKVSDIKSIPVNLFKISSYIHKKYLYATTLKKEIPNLKSVKNYILGGYPIVFIEYRTGEITDFPDDLRVIRFSDTLCFHYKTILIKKIPVHLWLIEKQEAASKSDLRMLRIALSKIHHNHICLQSMLQWVKNPNKCCTINYEELEKYYEQMIDIMKVQKEESKAADWYDSVLKEYYKFKPREWLDCESFVKSEYKRLKELREKKQMDQNHDNIYIIDSNLNDSPVTKASGHAKAKSEVHDTHSNTEELDQFNQEVAKLRSILTPELMSMLEVYAAEINKQAKAPKPEKTIGKAMLTAIENIKLSVTGTEAALLIGNIVTIGSSIIKRFL